MLMRNVLCSAKLLHNTDSSFNKPLFLIILLPFDIQVHNKYTAADFDEDLRIVLRRSGCKDEKIVFIMDESNVLDSSFLERMNTLLANGEVRIPYRWIFFSSCPK